MCHVVIGTGIYACTPIARCGFIAQIRKVNTYKVQPDRAHSSEPQKAHPTSEFVTVT